MRGATVRAHRSAKLGVYRTQVYIAVPIMCIYTLLMLLLACLKRHDAAKAGRMKRTAVEAPCHLSSLAQV